MTSTTPIAVQLYTLREALSQDFRGVIARLAEIGFVGVEPYGGLPVSPTEAAEIFSEFGLQVSSAHLPAPLGENQATSLAAAKAYGIKRTIVPYHEDSAFSTVAGIRSVCEMLNEANKVAQDNGLQLGYHNHNAEFQIVDGRSAHEIMLDHLDESVFLQVDTYWVAVGGQDPAQVVGKLGKRAPLLHIKDGPGNSRQSHHVAVGDGAMDIPAIVNANADYVEWLVVELDSCATDMMTAVERSYKYLVGKGLARGNR